MSISVLAVNTTSVPDVRHVRGSGVEVMLTLISSKLATRLRSPLAVNE